MLRRSKRGTKGWAIDVEDEVEHGGLRERLASNTKLWILCAIAVVGVAAVLFSHSLSTGQTEKMDAPVDRPLGTYSDSRHQEFTADFIKMARKRGIEIEAKFLSDRSFKMVIPSDVMSDEVAFLSRSAANGISRIFRANPVVWTYTESNDSAAPRLIAKATWSRELGGFAVKFERSTSAD